jgi:hypothetical protein
MAKKSTAKKAARKPSRAPVRKAAAPKTRKMPKKSVPRKPAKVPAALKPVPVKTGPGPTPVQIGQDLVAMFNQGQLAEIEDKWWSPKIISCEGGPNMEWRGRKAVHAKNAWWLQDHAVHGATAEGPYVGATGFAVKFRMEVETKSTGQRQVMEEIGVYTVKNGKIIREEFMGSTAKPEPVVAPVPTPEAELAPVGG